MFVFVYSLLLSTGLPGGVCRRLGLAGGRPRLTASGIEGQEALAADLLRTWLQGVPTDQFDPGLNKEKCVWIRTHVLSFVPSLPGKGPLPTCRLLEWGGWPQPRPV